MSADFSFERELWERGYSYVVGIDEVGRGCLAGPVVAAEVVFPRDVQLEIKLDDSKKLSPKKRQAYLPYILEKLAYWSVGISSVGEINEFGIVPATFNAMEKTVHDLGKSDFFLVDGRDKPKFSSINQASVKAVIKGDQLSNSIAAASIIAKEFRDALMSNLAISYPNYGWCRNKGYGTKEHREAIKSYGSTEFHRDLFIRNILDS